MWEASKWATTLGVGGTACVRAARVAVFNQQAVAAVVLLSDQEKVLQFERALDNFCTLPQYFRSLTFAVVCVLVLMLLVYQCGWRGTAEAWPHGVRRSALLSKSCVP